MSLILRFQDDDGDNDDGGHYIQVPLDDNDYLEEDAFKSKKP